MALCLACAAWAQDLSSPPDPLGSNPPVFQTLGLLDTTTNFVEEAECRVCHSSGVPNRHHLEYGQPISKVAPVPYPDTNGDGVRDTTYSCLSCHGKYFTVVRNCVSCHTTSPHHTGEDAVNRHCSECHGDLVADYDDGHYIPTYKPSFVTPWTGLHGAGWNDQLHTDPYHETDGGSGIVLDDDVLKLDTGITFNFGVELTRTDPAELRFKPAGDENDFMIDEPNRGTNVYHVVFLQGATLAADWVQATNTLTVTVAPQQTAFDLVDVINKAVAKIATSGARVRATKLLTDGTGDLLPANEYAPLGGLPFNNRGFGAGSCSYCHDDDGAKDINGDPKPVLVLNNHDNHHGIGLPTDVSNGAGGTWRKCNVCHDYTTPPRGGSYEEASGHAFDLHIRVCEECHSPASLHSIQALSPKNTTGTIVVGGETAGYGHVGRDGAPGDSDCWGCHGFEVAADSVSFSGPLIPTLYNSDVASISAGKNATVLLSGAAFTNTANGKSYVSDVRLTAGDGSSVTLKPDVILDQGNLAVTIPAGTRPGNYKLQAAKGDLASNPAVLSVVPAVTITRAIANGPVTITGKGFGGYARGSGTTVTGTVSGGRVRRRRPGPCKPRSFRGVTRKSSPVFARSRKR